MLLNPCEYYWLDNFGILSSTKEIQPESLCVSFGFVCDVVRLSDILPMRLYYIVSSCFNENVFLFA